MSDTLTQGQTPETELTPEELKADARDARIDKVLDDADQAPDSELPSNEVLEEITGMDGSATKAAVLDDREQKIAVARATAEQTAASMENVAPGSAVEQQNLGAMREARRTGSMTVDGLAPAPTTSVEDTATEISEPAPAPVAEVASEAAPVKKKGLWNRLFGSKEAKS